MTLTILEMKFIIKMYFKSQFFIILSFCLFCLALPLFMAAQMGAGGHAGGGYASGGEQPAQVTAVDLKVMLQGPFNGASMNSTLGSQALLPSQQPFDQDPSAPWYYTGAEEIPPSTDLSNTVNWLLLELRTSPGGPELAVSSTMRERVPALLQSDGSIRALDGSSISRFNYEDNDHVYVVVWSLNHLPVMNSTAMVKSLGYYDHDFTDAQGKAWQRPGVTSNPAMKPLGGGGMMGLFAGDCHADTLVYYTGTNNDCDAILSTVGSTTISNIVSGYHNEDLNMDGVVKYTGKDNDRTVIYNALEGNVGNTLHAHIPQ
jgi:hypothetical protein